MTSWNFENAQQTMGWPYGIAVARGDVPKMSGIQKFGYNASVGNTAFETIWENGGLYTYVDSAGTVALTSDDTDNDNGAVVEVQGLDGSYNLLTENVTVGGAASSGEFIRIFRMRLVSMPGSLLPVNQGNLSATVNDTVLARILEEVGQTLMAVYTVPAGKRAYLLSFDIGNSKDAEVEAKVMVRRFENGVFNTNAYSTLRGTPFRKEYRITEVIDEKNDIEIRAKSSSTASISAGFELLLEDK